MSEFPLISIVTPTYNCVETIEATLLSVLNQNYPRLELIVADGGSTDGTLEILKKYQDHISVLMSEKDRGIFDGMNKGCQQATGDLMGILNSADLYGEGILHRVAARFQNIPFQMLACDCAWVYPDRKIRVSPKPDQLKKGKAINHQSLFYRPSLHKEFGYYQIKYRHAADYLFIRQVYDRYGIEILDELACYYDLSGNSIINFMPFADDVRKICIELGDSRIQVEQVYWNKYIRYVIRRLLEKNGLNELLFLYRRIAHRQLLD